MGIRKNYFYQITLNGINILYPLITFPYVARVLQPEGLGEAQFAFNLALYFSVIASFGIPYYGIKEIGRSRNDMLAMERTFTELLVITAFTSLLSLTLYIIALGYVPSLDIQQSFAVVCGALILFAPLNIDWFFSGLEEFKVITLRSVTIKLISLFLLYGFVKTEHDVLIYLAVLTFSYVGNYLLNLLLLRKKIKLNFSGISLKRHRKPLLFILSSTFATTIYTSLDSVVLGLLSTDYQIGLYSAGVKLSKVCIPIVTGLSAVLIPSISQAIKANDQSYEIRMVSKSFSFILFLGIPISLGLFTYRELFITVLLGIEYIDAMPSMAYLSFLPLFIGLGYLFGLQVLVPNNLNRSLFLATLLGVMVFIMTNWLFTEKLGATGASIAILSTEIIVTLAYIYFCPKYLIHKLPYREAFFGIISASSFFLIHYVLQLLGMTQIHELVLGIILSAAFYFSIQHVVFGNPLVFTLFDTIRSKVRK